MRRELDEGLRLVPRVVALQDRGHVLETRLLFFRFGPFVATKKQKQSLLDQLALVAQGCYSSSVTATLLDVHVQGVFSYSCY